MKHVLSILLLLTVLPAFAQKATVERVASDPLNIAASKYPMTDLNGHTAPLVIVEVLTDNVEFKGNVLDGGVVRRTGEYWVYMGVGTKILRIQSDKFLPVDIRFPDYGIPRLEPASTYVVTLALPGSVVQSAGGGSLLVVNVKPAGANIAIDGVAYGVTPNAIEGLAVGKHDVRVSHAGYATATFTTSVSDTDISTVEGSLELLPEPQAAVPIVAAPASDPAEFSTTPVHLALCATGPDGRAVYITADQWQALSDSARSSYKPLGVCIADTDNPFLVELHDKDAAKGMKWGKAMKFNLPTTGQGETILNNVENLNDAFRVFGGTIMDNVYWTKEEKGTGAAWDILVNSGHLGFHSKTSAIGVRPVAPCPR